MADPDQLHQVIMNLATNAFHAMENTGGTLSVKLDELVLEKGGPVAEKTGLPEGKYIELQVSDTGEGMDARTISKIFDPYFSTKEKDKGTGLGLAVVHGIIHSHHGAILAESSPGKGSVFRVFLPAVEKPLVIKGQPALSDSIAAGRGEAVLFIDDEKTIRELASEFLLQAGYNAICLENGMRALEWLREGNLCDILVTDMTMPGMTGDELIEEVGKLCEGIPTILCTGYNHDVDRPLKTDASAFLEKPFSFPDLMAKVRNLLDM